MRTSVKDLINQLEKLNPNDLVFALLYTKDDVKELQHYDSQTNEVVYPYNDELAELVLQSMDDYDSIYEHIYNCMEQEISYQVDQLAKKENINTPEPASY
jgi:uncharacterized membrane-anchored protein YhcB (DUF1043 family)